MTAGSPEQSETGGSSTWEQPETVARFAGRDPDLRLLELLEGLADPAAFRALDLGCAGGRNTVVLAERGVDFQRWTGLVPHPGGDPS